MALKLTHGNWWSLPWLNPKMRTPSDVSVCLFFLPCFPWVGLFLHTMENFPCCRNMPWSISTLLFFELLKMKGCVEDWNTVGFLPKLFLTFFAVGRTSTLSGNSLSSTEPYVQGACISSQSGWILISLSQSWNSISLASDWIKKGAHTPFLANKTWKLLGQVFHLLKRDPTIIIMKVM